ncbi:MAG: PQQ-like beta-propeller repeat protein [Phycisphaerae bacterium]|nr:PQQ-like beta-propeller repeat protein [Phycisphaerae bacterium]
MKRSTMVLCLGLALVATTLVPPTKAGDWPGFRGPEGSGISAERGLPVKWDDNTNMAWKTPLPGPGSSSPIIQGKRVYVTCYSGYGTNRDEPGQIKNLARHLLCIDRSNGKVIWKSDVPAETPEDPFQGYLTEHGYATSTPVTDGERIYVFFGKSGVYAFDLDGKRLWHHAVGKSSSNRRWGSAASPILYKNLLIVNASEESRSLRALDRKTGREVWAADGDALQLAYATPVVVTLKDGRHDLVATMPEELWGLNPETGKLRWFAEIKPNGNISPTPVARDGIVYVYGGFRVRGSLAVRAGGKGDVTETHVVWTSRDSSYVPSPLLSGPYLYVVNDRGDAHCISAADGESVYQERLPTSSRNKPFYASPVLAEGRLYCTSRRDGTFILAADPKFKLIAQNRFVSDTSDFHGSPAVSDGQILLRSNKFLYCIQN